VIANENVPRYVMPPADQDGDVHLEASFSLTVSKLGHRFRFRWTESTFDQALSRVGFFAREPEFSITWDDAAEIVKTMRRIMQYWEDREVSE